MRGNSSCTPTGRPWATPSTAAFIARSIPNGCSVTGALAGERGLPGPFGARPAAERLGGAAAERLGGAAAERLGGAAAEEVGRAEQFGLLAPLAGQAGEAEPAALHDVGPVGQAERHGGELLDQQHAGP